MKPSEYPEYLLKIFYEEYQRNSVVKEYGLFADELTNKSGIPFEDALDAINRMRERGWIKVLSPRPARRLYHFDEIQLTEKGLQHAEWLLRSWHRKAFDPIRAIYVVTVEGITRTFTKH